MHTDFRDFQRALSSLSRDVFRRLVIGLMITIGAFLVWSGEAPAANAANIDNGKSIFLHNCAQCHLGGRNVVNREKTLKKTGLEKYGMYSPEAIIAQVTKGKAAMPAFRGRLSESQIEDVAAFVLDSASKDWKS